MCHVAWGRDPLAGRSEVHGVGKFTVVVPCFLQLDVKMPYSDPTSADAEWKKIQQNTFTRWCNEHLKCVNMYIHNLETDLCDGLKLIALLQVLSGKKLPRHNKKPNFQSQKMENVSIALKFIQQENIRLVNIGELLDLAYVYPESALNEPLSASNLPFTIP